MFSSVKQKLLGNGYIPDCIIDIGAHHGNWTKECLNIYPDSQYLIFEPIPYNELNQFINIKNMEVFNEILNEKECLVNWYEGKDTGDSFYKELSHHYKDIIPIQRNSLPLNHFLEKVKDKRKILLKINSQGSEIVILKGASKFYDKINFIILEMPFFGQYNENTPDFLSHIKFMDEIGFIPFDFLENHNINNFNMQVDIMFINKNHPFNDLVQKRLQLKDFNTNNSKTVAFLSNKLTLRGTEVALYDYADYNEKILGNKSIIITRDFEKLKHEFDVDIQAYNKFHDRFKVDYYNRDNAVIEIDNIVEKNNISHIFIEKAGDWDGLISNKCKNLIHCVFSSLQPHGQVYSVLGQTVNNICNTQCPVLPHMVTLPCLNDDLREELNIPKDAIVFGRYGGKESFDIKFVYNVIQKILETRTNIYFLFMNTNVFLEHHNIIYLPGKSDMIFKRKFINTCNALLHARERGETFGLTCGEFAICEKPVITWGNSNENEHLLILKEKAVLYTDENSLFGIINTFTNEKYNMKDNGYKFYSPDNVMNIFKNIFLD